MNGINGGHGTIARLTGNAAIVVSSGVLLTSLAINPASAQNVTCGSTIITDTALTADLVDCAGDGIVIDASNITLDLQGHLIDGIGSGDGVRISDGRSGVTIMNGRIQEFSEGVHLEKVDYNVVTTLQVSYNEFSGIELLDSDQNIIQQNVAHNNGEGIGLGQALDGNGSDGNRIYDNTVHDNANEGIALENGSELNEVSESVAYANGTGILVDSEGSTKNRIENNVADSNLSQGIHVGEMTTFVKANTANANVEYGIRALFGAVDGGGNKAERNGNEAQCENIICS